MMAVVELRSEQAGEFEDVRVIRGPRSGLTMAVAVHRTVDGRSLGGCRIWRYASDDLAVADVEGLARSMSYKAAAAGLSLGGGKGVIALPEDGLPGDRRRDALHDFAELVESFDGRYVTAQDVGASLADMAYVARFTDHVVGRAGQAGDPAPYTAHGVETAIRASAGPVDGRRIVVVGLGHVGGELARRLAAAGARLVLSDIDPDRRALTAELDADWVDPEAALDTEADVLAPCALGGILDEAAVERLRVPVVAGAANNQLTHDAVAELLHRRGILWAPDFIANAGGLIAVADELWGFDRGRVERRIATIAKTLAEVYARTTTSTLAAAKELAADRLGGN
jgi:leucine dehydrogenase